MAGILAGRLRVITVGALLAVLLLGCSQCSYDEQIADERNKEFLASQGVTSAPSEATVAPAPEPELSGTWAGELRFDQFRIHLKEDGAEEIAEQVIAETIGKDFPIAIVITEGQGGKRTATLAFGEGEKLKGTVSGTPAEFTISFKKAGDKEFKVGATMPMEYTFGGFVEQAPGSPAVMRGKVVWKTLQANGKVAWEELGKWSAQRK